MKFNKSMFGKIEEKLKKTSKTGGFGNLLRYSAEGKYVVKLLFHPEDEKRQIEHYMEHGWESTSTGSYMTTVSLQGFGERDPISENFWVGIKSEDEDIKERYKKLARRDKYMINVLVVNDPNNSDNNGKVKVLKYSKQLKEIIDAAIDPEHEDYDEDLGVERVFGYDEGVFLQINAIKKGPFTGFDKSKFITRSKDFDLDEDEFYEVYDNLHDLSEEIPEVKSFSELEEILYEHWFSGENSDLLDWYENLKGDAAKKASKQSASKAVVDEDDDDDDIPYDDEPEEKPKKTKKATKKTKKVVEEEEDDDEMDELLSEFE